MTLIAGPNQIWDLSTSPNGYDGSESLFCFSTKCSEFTTSCWNLWIINIQSYPMRFCYFFDLDFLPDLSGREWLPRRSYTDLWIWLSWFVFQGSWTSSSIVLVMKWTRFATKRHPKKKVTINKSELIMLIFFFIFIISFSCSVVALSC